MKNHRPFGAALRYVLVFILLGPGQIVIFVKDGIRIFFISFPVGGPDNANASPGHVPESDVESCEFSPQHKENAVRRLGIIGGCQEVR